MQVLFAVVVCVCGLSPGPGGICTWFDKRVLFGRFTKVRSPTAWLLGGQVDKCHEISVHPRIECVGKKLKNQPWSAYYYSMLWYHGRTKFLVKKQIIVQKRMDTAQGGNPLLSLVYIFVLFENLKTT